MISIIIIIISVITGFALQHQFLEEVGSIGVSLWGQRVAGGDRGWQLLTGLRLLSVSLRGAQADPYADWPEFLEILQYIILLNLHSNKCSLKKKYLQVSMTTGTMKRCSQWREDACHPITAIISFLNNLSDSLLPPRSTIWFASADENGINEV